jgi:hydrogenase-1 operon protein HyaF
MSGLNDIPVNVEAGTGNVKPLLHEVRHALQRLSRGEQGTVIDLSSLPLAPGEEARIEEALGEGEVSADLNALGHSSIRETAYSGVWIVTHRNTENEVVARFIEINHVPEILKAQPEDIEHGVQGLNERLNDVKQEAM